MCLCIDLIHLLSVRGLQCKTIYCYAGLWPNNVLKNNWNNISVISILWCKTSTLTQSKCNNALLFHFSISLKKSLWLKGLWLRENLFIMYHRARVTHQLCTSGDYLQQMVIFQLTPYHDMYTTTRMYMYIVSYEDTEWSGRFSDLAPNYRVHRPRNHWKTSTEVPQ